MAVCLAPASGGAVLQNPGFEATPFTTGWTATGVTQQAGLNGSTSAARLPYGTAAKLSQSFTATADFTVDVDVMVAGNTTAESFRILLDTAAGNAIELRGALGNALQVIVGGTACPLTSTAGGGAFTFGANQQVRFRIVGRGIGTPAASYDIAWSDAGGTTAVHAVKNVAAFSGPAAAQGGITRIAFDRINASAHSYWVDDVSFTPGAGATPAADHRLTPPLQPKIVNISGVYPHLAVTNANSECGIGAVVPWQGDLWAVTYSPHEPGGSNDKLYQISPALAMTARPESIGGTPANRFIHTPSNQLIIGPHFIDAAKNVRTLPYSLAPGRHTAVASHLTDPANRVYFFTMEDGLYDVNVHDLSFITRYPDKQSDDPFLFGYHGKGAYTGGGRLIVSNNGRQDNQNTLTGASGVLASWDGAVRGAGNANPDYMTAWTEHHRVQHCEVTGPGGIYGAENAADPVWATGFDAKSVILRSWQAGAWTTWRLPKSSYTHDGSHGWHTEWPRIREISPGRLLMHMHGMFFDFPGTFSAADFSGLSPICSYYKMPVDYCTWEGRLVIGKNDASLFANNLVSRDQSNFWFGQPEDLRQWGAPQGHGSVWQTEAVTAGQASDPFLIRGFSDGTLHLRNGGAAPLPVELQTSSGTGGWTTWRSLTVPAGGYAYDLLEAPPGAWIRLVAGAASTNVTAAFMLANAYPHVTPASAGTSRFDAIADIRDERGLTDGLIRVMPGTDLKLEIASKHVPATGPVAGSYAQIGADMALTADPGNAMESALRTAAATTKDFGSDAASAWVTLTSSSSVKLRLPKGDPLYDSEFASGWARGHRETVTERSMLNCHGTFYEIPRDSAGGRRKLQPITTHNKRITDLASWRGLLVITGVLDSAAAGDTLVRSADGHSALWLGEIDDIWRMGEPRGTGGPWLDTPVTANTASDAYLMYGYRGKVMALSHQATTAVTFRVEVDFLGDNTWSTYRSFTVQPGETHTHTFPAAFSAHWVRVVADRGTTATARFTYGPAGVRDRFLDWARASGLPTGGGRAAVALNDDDHDAFPALVEYALGGAADGTGRPALLTPAGTFGTLLRDTLSDDGISCVFEVSDDLAHWTPRPDLLQPSPDQGGVPTGFTRMSATPADHPQKRFYRMRAFLP